MPTDPEFLRIQARDSGKEDWNLWGPYLSDRQWGTAREDYSADGDAWTSFPHDHARSRTYRWGDDGLLGISDNRGLLCFAPAFWNGKDSILKERAFGLKPAGQPRRGHQGLLLPHRQHPHPLVHARTLQIPAGRVSLNTYV